MSQFCISCGVENQNEAKFCKSCGQKLKTQEEYEFDIKEKSSYSENNIHRNRQDSFIAAGNFSLFSFSGCISRQTYWAIIFATNAIPLIVVFIAIVVAIVYSAELNFDPRSIDKESLVFIFIIPTFLWLWIGFVTSIKRLRDANFSAWLYLINIIPYLGTLIILVLNGFFPSVEEENKYCKSRNNLSSKAIKWAYSLSIIPIILIVMAIVLSKLTDNNENVNDVLTKIPIEKEIINTAREIPTNVLTDKDKPHIRMETYTTDQKETPATFSEEKELPPYESEKPNSKWIDVSKSTCLENGGEWKKSENKLNMVCSTEDWKVAKNICFKSKGRLPFTDEFSDMISTCGIEVSDGYYTNENDKNMNYKNCYSRLGFGPESYWSSFIYDNYTDEEQPVSIADATLPRYYENNSRSVRCQKSKNIQANEYQNSAIQKNTGWIDISSSVCENNGGKYIDVRRRIDTEFVKTGAKACSANWEQANKMCLISGGRLASEEEFEKIITSCGGVLYDKNDNNKKLSYKQCYNNLGFTTSYYWNSLEVGSDKRGVVNFDTGSLGLDNQGKDFPVRCLNQ